MDRVFFSLISRQLQASFLLLLVSHAAPVIDASYRRYDGPVIFREILTNVAERAKKRATEVGLNEMKSCLGGCEVHERWNGWIDGGDLSLSSPHSE